MHPIVAPPPAKQTTATSTTGRLNWGGAQQLHAGESNNGCNAGTGLQESREVDVAGDIPLAAVQQLSEHLMRARDAGALPQVMEADHMDVCSAAVVLDLQQVN